MMTYLFNYNLSHLLDFIRLIGNFFATTPRTPQKGKLSRWGVSKTAEKINSVVHFRIVPFLRPTAPTRPTSKKHGSVLLLYKDFKDYSISKVQETLLDRVGNCWTTPPFLQAVQQNTPFSNKKTAPSNRFILDNQRVCPLLDVLDEKNIYVPFLNFSFTKNK